MTYRIVLTQNAIDDYEGLDARTRSIVRDAIHAHLAHEPTKESKSRIKRLKELKSPEYRLRVGTIRIFYDVITTDVVVLAIMPKERTIQWLSEHGKN